MRFGLAVCMSILGLCAQARAGEFTSDSLVKVKKNVDGRKAILVDVRSKGEWDDGHIEGAVFLPITELEQLEPAKITRMLPKKKIIYAHCAVGMRAEAAGEILAQYGYDVRALQPGYEKLIKAGFKKAEERSVNDSPR